MKIYGAKYSAEHNTEDNSLVANLLKYPEIAKKVVELYPRYTTTYLLEKLGFGAGEKVLGDNSFEWKMMGRYRAQQLQGADLDISEEAGFSTDKIPVGGAFELSIDDTTANPCMINASDIIRLADGSQAHVTSAAASSSDLVVLTCKALSVITANVLGGGIVGVIGNAFGEGSDGADVGEGYSYPETRKNWLTISRKKLVIDARDLTDVTWVEHNGHRLWFFTKEQQTEAQFMYDLEVMRWFGRTSIVQYTEGAGVSGAGAPVTGIPLIGDGILAQIADANVLTYNEATGSAGDFDLSEDVILDFIGQLSLNAENATGNEYVVFTGTQGKIQFHKAMKDLLVSTGSDSSILVDKFGQDVSVGANFSSYFALGNKITVAHCPVFDDPNIATAPGYTSTASSAAAITGTGFNSLKLSALMVFLDMGSTQGVANVELITKGAEGINRNFVKKYVPGMINPYDSKSMMAASGDDKFEVHWLTQSGIIVRNPLSCGILKPTGLTV